MSLSLSLFLQSPFIRVICSIGDPFLKESECKIAEIPISPTQFLTANERAQVRRNKIVSLPFPVSAMPLRHLIRRPISNPLRARGDSRRLRENLLASGSKKRKEKKRRRREREKKGTDEKHRERKDLLLGSERE